MYGSDSNGEDRLSNFGLEDEDLNCSSSGLSFSKNSLLVKLKIALITIDKKFEKSVLGNIEKRVKDFLKERTRLSLYYSYCEKL